MKVALRRRKPHWTDKPGDHIVITRSWPFFQNKPTGYVHRVREATMFFYRGEYSHTGIQFWCGGAGFSEGKGRLAKTKHRKDSKFIDQPDAHLMACATCEGRAIGAGQLGSRMLCGRMLMFAPRR